MKWLTAIVVTGTALGALGCEPPPKFLGDEEVEMNEAMVEMYKVDQYDGAVVRQQTLYAYHFISDSAELTELGHRDVDVLANHYRNHPGRLSIRRQGVSEDLYTARRESVMTALVDGGVDASRMELADTLPGGGGITSEEGLVIWNTMLETTTGGGNSSIIQDARMQDQPVRGYEQYD